MGGGFGSSIRVEELPCLRALSLSMVRRLQFSHIFIGKLYQATVQTETGLHIWSQMGKLCSNDPPRLSATLLYLHLLQNPCSAGL